MCLEGGFVTRTASNSNAAQRRFVLGGAAHVVEQRRASQPRPTRISIDARRRTLAVAGALPTLPSLIVATCGGGTGLATQRQCLEMLGCHGPGKADKLAEIVVLGLASTGARAKASADRVAFLLDARWARRRPVSLRR
jgi:hypothetical protein